MGEAAIWGQETQPNALWQTRGVGWGRQWEDIQEGGDIHILVADSCCCMAEATITLKSNYPPIKNILRKN